MITVDFHFFSFVIGVVAGVVVTIFGIAFSEGGTAKCPPWVLKSRYGMEISEKAFNKKRRQFYYLLAIKKQII